MFRESALKICVVIFLITQVFCDHEPSDRQPIYRYRYQTEDMMKSSASSVPVKGYHVVEGGYYPAESGIIGSGIGPVGGGAGLGIGAGHFIGPIGYGGVGAAGLGGAGIGGFGLGAGPIGYGGGVGPIGVGGIGYGTHYIGGGGVGTGIGATGLGGGGYIAPIVHGYGGGEVEKSEYSKEKKNLEDAKFEKAHGSKGEQFNQGQEGYSQGGQAVKDVKGEEGYFSNKAGGKNIVQDGKHYQGGQSYNQEGKNGAENNVKKGHKKGHIIKGFKNSHHKDESGKTEEFYDEEHDEGNNFAFQGQNGAFGHKGESSFKGGHEDGKFNEQEQKKAGHVSSEYAVNKENSNKGQYGQNKYAGGGSVYGVNNGIDQQSLLGHQENSKFFKHQPVPFYHHY